MSSPRLKASEKCFKTTSKIMAITVKNIFWLEINKVCGKFGLQGANQCLQSQFFHDHSLD